MSAITPTGNSLLPSQNAPSSTGPKTKERLKALKVPEIDIPDRFGMIPSDYTFEKLSPFSPKKALKAMDRFFAANG